MRVIVPVLCATGPFGNPAGIARELRRSDRDHLGFRFRATALPAPIFFITAARPRESRVVILVDASGLRRTAHHYAGTAETATVAALSLRRRARISMFAANCC